MHVVKLVIMNFEENVEMTLNYSNQKSDNGVVRKRQIKCGVCSGCQVLQNCGLCVFCIKRKTGKQICKERKCLQILKIQLERKKKNFKKESKRKQAYNNYHQNLVTLTDNVNANLTDKITKRRSSKKTSIKYHNEALKRTYDNISVSNEKTSNKLVHSSNSVNDILVSQITLPTLDENLIKFKLLENESEVNLLKTTTPSSLESHSNILDEKYKKLQSPKQKVNIQSPKKYKLSNTPEITEPRTSILESEEDLIKKVRPHSAGPLPSFSTFVHELSLKPHNIQLLSLPTSPKNSFFTNKSFDSKPDSFKHKKSVQLKYSKIKINSECGCAVSDTSDSGPFYNHLGSGYSLNELRNTLLDRFSIQNSALNLQLVKHTSVEGKNGDGCPLAKWIIRRTSDEEKYLVVVRHHEGHTCSSTFTVIVIVAWEGISKQYADDMYRYLTKTLNESGFRTRRRCSANESKTCLCQGEVEESQGASFSFGCSWSMFFDGCKFTKSTNARKFKMQDPVKEEEIEKVLQEMTTQVSPLLKIWAPKCYENMTHFEEIADKCRIGLNKGRPFSGVTCCLDFCAHSHRDIHDLNNGTTMVCTLLKPNYNERTDEQLHVLPLYQLLDDRGNILPCNYDNPPHLIKSKITARHDTCGRYVNPVAVNLKKFGNEQKTFLKNEGANLLCSDFPKHPRFCSESDVPYVLSQRETLPIQNIKKEMIFVDESEIPVYRQCSDYFNFEDYKLSTKKMEHNNSSSPFKKCKEHVSKPTVITQEMGGVAIALGHGSFLVECAKKELHATTALRNPERSEPTRLSMVFYQHKKLNKKDHGYEDYQEKINGRLKERLLKNERSFDDLSLLADTAALNKSPCIAFTNISDIKPFMEVGQFKKSDHEKKNLLNSKTNSFSIASLINVNPDKNSHKSQLNETVEYNNIIKKTTIEDIDTVNNVAIGHKDTINTNAIEYNNIVNNIGINYNIRKDEIVPLLQNKTEKLPTFSIFKKSLYFSKDIDVEGQDKCNNDNKKDAFFDQLPISMPLVEDKTLKKASSSILKEDFKNSENESKTGENSNTENKFELLNTIKIKNENLDFLKKRCSSSNNYLVKKCFKTDSGLLSTISSDSNSKREVVLQPVVLQSLAVDNCFISKDKKENFNEKLTGHTVSIFHDCMQNSYKESVTTDKLLVTSKDSSKVGEWNLNENMFQKVSIKKPWENFLTENVIDSNRNFSEKYCHNETHPFYNDLFTYGKSNETRKEHLTNEKLNETHKDTLISEKPFTKRNKQFDVNSILSNQCTKYHAMPTDHRSTFTMHQSATARHNLCQNFESHIPTASPNNIHESSFYYLPGFDDGTRFTYASPETHATSNFNQATPIIERSFSTSNSDLHYKNAHSVSSKKHRCSLPLTEHFEFSSFELQDNLLHNANNSLEISQSRYLPISDNLTQNHSIFQPLGPFSETFPKSYPT
ncbi:uncharacterized protein LOC100213294 isoform X1 [Hydra vulgaris]|uniref:uncharacterized protein LOC100213294 isoform X1 n=1 Tax=Hydra vulgaris TaxID=6087 RepID=UPI001F5F6DB7|nr:uncharacterized protein LOC100213294 isoform X1 [Hydra vulgaris]